MKTSVIIPPRNEGAVVDIARAAQSVADEVIVIDGHSTDGSPEALRAHDRGRGKE